MLPLRVAKASGLGDRIGDRFLQEAMFISRDGRTAGCRAMPFSYHFKPTPKEIKKYHEDLAGFINFYVQ